MTYARIVMELLDASQDSSLIQTRFEGDIWQMNIINPIVYPVFIVSATEPQIEYDNTMQWNLTLYYADRLQESNSNPGVPDTLGTHSAGITELSSIISRFQKRNYADILEFTMPVSYTLWSETEVFTDKLNGVWCTISFRTPKTDVC